MMLFKLSLKNIRKSFKDYAIYFLTLILGVAIFYVFNAIDSQQAMIAVSESQKEILKLMITMLSGVSVCVALILGFLIIYANNFLIKRRKKEFAIYMTLGMGRRDVSKILFGETILIGCMSLVVGLIIGVFASQFMSILVAKMFEADMTQYIFTFSEGALFKTIIYFGIIYLIVILFNVVMLSKYQLIDLFQAKRKVEHTRLKSSFLAVIVFLLAAAFLGYAYYSVTVDFNTLSAQKISIAIAMGCVSTYFIFWSLAGFLLKLIQRFRTVYLSGLNAFVLRQINSNINTSVFSMTIICLLFFVTICVLSTGFSVNNAMRKSLEKYVPVELNLYKSMDYPEEGYTKEQIAGSNLTVEESLLLLGTDMSLLKDTMEITEYTCEELTLEASLGSIREKVLAQFPYIRWDSKEPVVGISEYNKVAKRYGLPVFMIEEGKYIEVCNMTQMKKIRDEALAGGAEIKIGDHVLTPQYEECQDGFIYITSTASNMGITIVADELIEEEAGKALQREENLFIADYAAEDKEGKQRTEDTLLNLDDTALSTDLQGMTKLYIYEASTGLGAIATFIAIYLGIIFLIAGAALLALKELSESADNKERFQILNKIGVDKKMQNRALLWQMGIFFGIPMLLAVIHSVFGIQFAQNALSVMYKKEDMIVSIVVTAAILVGIYGVYFISTYFGCKRIIDEK